MLALQDALNMKDDNVFKATTGLHGGIGFRGDVCGSLLGACMMIGLMCGRSPEEVYRQDRPEHAGGEGHPVKKDDPVYLAGELYDWYGKEFGSVKCEIVRGRHEQETIAEAGRELTPQEITDGFHAKCDELTGKTAARAVEIIWDAIEETKKK
jgi:hypothetical protein